MKTIYKYPIAITDRQTIEMPANAEIFSVGKDPAGTICVWATVENLNPKEAREIFVVGTGNPIPEKATKVVGSVTSAPFVWHVFTT